MKKDVLCSLSKFVFALCVLGVAACSSSNSSGSGGGIDTTPPSVPQNLVATAASSSQINLTWNTSTDNVGVSGYKIYRDGTLATTITGTTYHDSGLSPNTPYSYTVCAYDATNNTSSQSNTASARTPVLPDTQAPTVPAGLAANPASSSQINLTWDAATDNVGVTGYNVYRGGTRITSVTATSFNDTGLPASTQQCYTISAYDGASNESGQSSSVCATTPALPDTQPPTIPAGLAANAVAPDQINLTWNAATDNVGVTGYNVYRGGTRIASVTATSFNDTGLPASTQQCYTISAYDGANNESNQSSSVCATTPAAPDTQAPTVPTGLSVSAVSSSQIDLSWTASSDNIGVVGYNIYRNNTYFMTVSGTSAQNTGLASSTQYCYAISAIDAANNESAQTSQQCATTDFAYTTLSGQWAVIMHGGITGDLYVDASITQIDSAPLFHIQGSGVNNYTDPSGTRFYLPVTIDNTGSTYNSDTMVVQFLTYTDASSVGCGTYVTTAAGTATDYSNIAGGAWSETDYGACANSGTSWEASRVPDLGGTWWAQLAFGGVMYSYNFSLSQIGTTITVNSIVDHNTLGNISHTATAGVYAPATSEATLTVEGLPCPNNATVLGTLSLVGRVNAAGTTYTANRVEFHGCPAGTESGSGTVIRQ